MDTPTDPSLEEAEAPNPSKELRGLIRAAVKHVGSLGELASIEAQEAGEFALRRAVMWALVAASALFFHALVMAGLIGWLAIVLAWEWYWVAFALACLHLLFLLVTLIILACRPKQAFFAETKAQLQRDQQCLQRSQPDESKS